MGMARRKNARTAPTTRNYTGVVGRCSGGGSAKRRRLTDATSSSAVAGVGGGAGRTLLAVLEHMGGQLWQLTMTCQHSRWWGENFPEEESLRDIILTYLHCFCSTDHQIWATYISAASKTISWFWWS
ncbi:hypothetical protein QYE76_005502 [Lolium multiflorum]|uniref:Uncharacterized protein n=1 Tax=Lolium multiflorum TaxID=4521 RepID=A0AAD8W184_LOLMU|nr:hypothetical protein QYE76_005502 [Lolium multiflorum]